MNCVEGTALCDTTRCLSRHGGSTSAPIGIAETRALALGSPRRFMVSALWSESVAAEVVVFFLLGPSLVRGWAHMVSWRLPAWPVFVRGVVVMGSTTAVVALALVQPLHGLTFAALH